MREIIGWSTKRHSPHGRCNATVWRFCCRDTTRRPPHLNSIHPHLNYIPHLSVGCTHRSPQARLVGLNLSPNPVEEWLEICYHLHFPNPIVLVRKSRRILRAATALSRMASQSVCEISLVPYSRPRQRRFYQKPGETAASICRIQIDS